MKLVLTILTVLLDILPAGKAMLEQLQPRDSILVADQLAYGFLLDGVTDATTLGLTDVRAFSGDTLTVIGGWQMDTLLDGRKIGRRAFVKALKEGKTASIKGYFVIAPFEEGLYTLPGIPVLRNDGTRTDTLIFEGVEMEVRSMPVDTNTFVLNDIKGQVRYPLTAAEILPWAAGLIALSTLIVLLTFWLLKRRKERAGQEAKASDPAYIVALRELDKYRSDKFWAPEKQKQFYSGITDALKFYIEDRFGVDAPEMTTAELFDALGKESDIQPELFVELKELFENADFVKFAKHTAPDEDNAKALPLAVRFVTSTYRIEVEHEADGAGAGEEGE